MTLKTRTLFLARLLSLSLIIGAFEASAAVPQVLNHQGRVSVGGENFDGSGQFKFALVNGEGTTSYWSNDGTSNGGAEPSDPVTLAVNKGLYSVLLGDDTLAKMTVIPASALDNDGVHLRVWFSDGSRGFQQFSPDQRLAATPYAVQAVEATGFSGSLAGDVTGTQGATAIAASTVTGKFLTGYVSGAGTLSPSDSILTALNKLNGNDALKADLNNPTFTGTVSGITKSMVDLGNVDNTADADKPVSNAQQAAMETALALKADVNALVLVEEKAQFAEFKAFEAMMLAGQANDGLALKADVAALAGVEEKAQFAEMRAFDAMMLAGQANDGLALKADVAAMETALAGKQVAGDYATLVDGTVPAIQLPSYVDDVVEFAEFGNFPEAGEVGKIYVATATGKIYRWSGTQYIGIDPSPGSSDAVAEGSSNLYYTAERAAADAPVQSVAGRSGVVTLSKVDVGLGNVDNTADAEKPVSTAQQAALALKADVNALARVEEKAEFVEMRAFEAMMLAGQANDGLALKADVAALAGVEEKAQFAEMRAFDAMMLAGQANDGLALKADVAAMETALAGKQVAGDYATLVDGTVPAIQLPSYVDDVVEFAEFGNFPEAGEVGKIYVATATGKIYRWSGTQYIGIDPSPGSSDAVAEGSSNLYYTAERAAADAPVQSVAGRSGVVTLSKVDVGLGNVDNTADAEKPVSTAQQAALALKADVNALARVEEKAEFVEMRAFEAMMLAGQANDGLALKADVAALAGVEEKAQFAEMRAFDAMMLAGQANDGLALKADVAAMETALAGKQVAGDYATLVDGTVPAIQLPSYVDDVVEFAEFGNFPEAGEVGKIYVATATGKIYRWSGTQYIGIDPSPGSSDAVAEGSSNLYYTAERAAADAPVQSVAGRSGVVTLSKVDVGLGNVDNTADADKPVSTVQQAAMGTALALKADVNALVLVEEKAQFAEFIAFEAMMLAGQANDGLALKADVAALAGVEEKAQFAEMRAFDAMMLAGQANDGLALKADVATMEIALDGKQASGDYATLVDGTVPAIQLPSYVDDVVEFAEFGNFPEAGEVGKIYVATATGKIYRWSGTQYIGIDPSPGSSDAVAEGSSNLYYTAERAAAAAPVQSVAGRSGVVTLSKVDVGLGNVDNTADADKPVSTAQQTALALKAPLASPTFTGTVSGITAGMVDLGNVDNTADADKPVSNALQTALALKAPLASPTFTGTVSGITKSMVGLANVDNTSDADKPVSTAQQAALDSRASNAALNLKAPLASPTFTGTVLFPVGSTTSAPLQLAAGSSLTAPVFGSVEFDGDQLYLTGNAGNPTRRALAFADGQASSVELSTITAAPLKPVVAWGDNGNGQTTVPPLSSVQAIAAGESHSLALLDGGTVVAWGGNLSGQVTVPTGLTDVTAVAAGSNHNLALKADGTVVAWGDNLYGQATVPAGINTATQVAAGEKHSLVLLADGTVRVWGNDAFDQLTPPLALTGVTVTAIAAGYDHSLALTAAGTVVAWGRSTAGQLEVPNGLSGVTAIAAGAHHCLALKSDGTVVAWGWNNADQSLVPAGLSGVSRISAGYGFSMALKSDRTPVVWGLEPNGGIPEDATQVISIAAGSNHALALRADAITGLVARRDQDNFFTGKVGIGRIPKLNALEVEGNASKSTAGSWLSNSDRRIKAEVESIAGALETLDQVRLVDFRYTEDYLAAHPEIEDRRYPNVIAQEFAQVFPDDVKGSGQRLPDGSEILQVDTYPLTIYSAAAVQELHRQNKELKAQLADQEQRLLKLEEILKNK